VQDSASAGIRYPASSIQHPASTLRILFIGDIVGEPGRRAISQSLSRLKAEFVPDFVIANAENAAGGVGITKDTALDIFGAGVNVITLGNHAWSKKEAYDFIDQDPRVLRPANYPSGAPGRGYALYETQKAGPIGVISLCGRVFMDSLDNPFLVADSAIEAMAGETRVIIVDFHGEATSEKIAFAWYVDGRVSAVIGTHTHVQTADERVLPGGTACITDVGMTGPTDSVIGVRKELIISRFLTQMPSKFEVAEGQATIRAVVIDVDPATGRATKIVRM
jgi:hypothetical protein